MRNTFVATLALLLMALIFVPATTAQEISDEELNRLCPALVDAAYAQFGANCGNVEVGDTCYGFTGAAAYDDITGLLNENYLTPSQRVSLSENEVIDIDEFDFFADIFGISMKEIRADLPVALGETVKVIGFNEVRLEGGVRPEEQVMLPDSPLPVNAGGAEVFSVPPGYGDEVSEPVGVAPLNEPLFADAKSPAEDWVRVYFEHPGRIGIDASAWVRVADIVGDVDLAALPVYGPDDRTISQEIYLTNDTTTVRCEAAPPHLIMVIAPEGIESTIYINDAELVVTDTVLIEVVPRDNALRVVNQDTSNYTPEPTVTQNGINPNDRALLHCIVVAGFMECEDIVLPSGYEAFLCLVEGGNLGIDDNNTLDWTLDPECGGAINAGPVSAELANRLANSLTNLPPNVTGRPIEVFIVIIPSGVGPVQPIIRRVKINDIVEFERLCAEGVIPADICAAEGFGSN